MGANEYFKNLKTSFDKKKTKNELQLKEFHEETCFEEKMAKLRVD